MFLVSRFFQINLNIDTILQLKFLHFEISFEFFQSDSIVYLKDKMDVVTNLKKCDY